MHEDFPYTDEEIDARYAAAMRRLEDAVTAERSKPSGPEWGRLCSLTDTPLRAWLRKRFW
jgi:hypothetical protein